MSLLLVITGTHYVPSEHHHPEISTDINYSKTTKGVKLMYDLVSKYYNNLPIMPVKPQYIMSTDDTVVYTFEDLETKQENF